MLAIKRIEYEKIVHIMKLPLESKESCIDVYHKNNWDRFTMHYDEETKNECPFVLLSVEYVDKCNTNQGDYFGSRFFYAQI